MPPQQATSFDDDLKTVTSGFESDLATVQQAVAEKQPVPHDVVSRLLEWLPTAGGALGGIVGGIGGTVAGMGVGGVPGAVGGAALGGAAGEGFRQAIETARGVEQPRTSTQAMEGIGGQAALQGGSELAGGMIGAGMKAAAPRIMQSALKPTMAMLKDAIQGAPVPRVVQTLLDEGVNVTPKGLQKLNGLLSSSQADVKASLDAAEAAGHTISPYRVASRLKDTAQTFAKQVDPAADLEAVSQTGQRFLEAHGGQALSPTEAQGLKTGTYQQIRKKYGQLGTADTEAQKALARGLKEELEKVAPGLESQNAQLAARSEASKAVGRRVAVAANRDVGGLADLAISHPLTFLTVMSDRSPAFKSLVARGAYNAAGSVAKIAPQAIRLAVQGLLSSGDEQ